MSQNSACEMGTVQTTAHRHSGSVAFLHKTSVLSSGDDPNPQAEGRAKWFGHLTNINSFPLPFSFLCQLTPISLFPFLSPLSLRIPGFSRPCKCLYKYTILYSFIKQSQWQHKTAWTNMEQLSCMVERRRPHAGGNHEFIDKMNLSVPTWQSSKEP